jgi:hypothetical protein
MRSKAVWVFVVVAAGWAWIGNPGGSAIAKDEGSCFGEATYMLRPPEGVEPKRQPVKFPHHDHFQFGCVKCHHTFEGTEPPMGCTVSGCHDVVESERGPGSADAWDNNEYYKTALHKTCWLGCHKEIKAKNALLQKAAKAGRAKLEKSGPTTCNGCHQPIAAKK